MEIAALRQQFQRIFPHNPGPFLLSQAPGRVNLIGEHTDYNDGFVCPMALDRLTYILAAPRKDAMIRLHSTSVSGGEIVDFPIDRQVPKSGPSWSLYAKGAAESVRRRTKLTSGIDALIHSTIPQGGGLSSSAAFEVATALALLAANQQSLDPVDLALACQWAEHEYPGMPCGIMDQFISVMGQQGHALLLDCRDRTTRQVPLDDPEVRVVISNSNVKHALVTGEYAARRQQCQAAVKALAADFPQVHSLRDASMEMLAKSRPHMDPIAYRRATHVVSEIQRTLAFAAALERRDYVTCGRLMSESHTSLRDHYQVSCAEIDSLVKIASAVPGVFGARITGGGFGGCIVTLCKADAVKPLMHSIETKYPQLSNGKSATTFDTTASDGATVKWL